MDHQWIIYGYGWWLTKPLWKRWDFVNWDDYSIQNLNGKIKFMFQTTNQITIPCYECKAKYGKLSRYHDSLWILVTTLHSYGTWMKKGLNMAQFSHPDAPCMESLPTLAFKTIQFCRYINIPAPWNTWVICHDVKNITSKPLRDTHVPANCSPWDH